ncbi:FAD-dependent oxidoreductase [Paenibacillus hodogayensis]|uniref:FAD-dependent oxidoreductase n=1 Tax=Paenibacillus hodogayensis TaxID=279208 RepID=A0ABV5VSP7_9BACL
MRKELKADIAIVGGGLGGCAAALAAAKAGRTVVMTEETAWIGGQATSQGVPPDEHRWIEKFGCTASYRAFRDGVRAYYRAHFPLTAEARAELYFNPGGALVSRVSHEPRTALAVLQHMLAPFIHSGRLIVLTRHEQIAAETDGDLIRSVTLRSRDSGERIVLTAPYVLDATECGDLLPLAGIEYVAGSESRNDTGEPHALPGAADPNDMQAITHCFAMDYREGEDHTITRPDDYAFWREYRPAFWPGRMFDWVGPHVITLEPRQYTLFSDGDLFPLYPYRRIADNRHFAPGTYESDITMVNWPQNDYFIGSIIDVSAEEKERHLLAAKQMSLSFLYWMQTEAPRPDGKVGYPGLRLRGDVFGTEDGLALAPYIRESRRIRAETTVLEQHISRAYRSDGAERYTDSVGIGYYAIDLHPSTGQRHYLHIGPYPFQIPLGSLLPERVDNVLAAGKNIGTTHITNGCYRLHPVEWNIGEAAGSLAAFCVERGVRPRQVRADQELLDEFRKRLVRQGVELEWPFVPA